MELKKLNKGQNVRVYLPENASVAFEIKGKIVDITDGVVAVEHKNKDGVNVVANCRPVDVMEIL